MQRPIQLDPKDKEIVITAENWTQYVGNSKYAFANSGYLIHSPAVNSAYYGFYVFFTEVIKTRGVEGALGKYIFSDLANADPGQMLIRTMSGACVLYFINTKHIRLTFYLVFTPLYTSA